VILAITVALQIIVVIASHSVALLADTIHNAGDATTAIPLWIAFSLARWNPVRLHFWPREGEDFAGFLSCSLSCSARCCAGYEAMDRFFHRTGSAFSRGLPPPV
jgi:Co/Zn/Cd efflux system component